MTLMDHVDVNKRTIAPSWIVIKGPGGFTVNEGRDRIATITTDGSKWMVHFVHRDELDFYWHGANDALNICVGYVRGIERVRQLV